MAPQQNVEKCRQLVVSVLEIYSGQRRPSLLKGILSPTSAFGRSVPTRRRKELSRLLELEVEFVASMRSEMVSIVGLAAASDEQTQVVAASLKGALIRVKSSADLYNTFSMLLTISTSALAVVLGLLKGLGWFQQGFPLVLLAAAVFIQFQRHGMMTWAVDLEESYELFSKLPAGKT